MKCSPRFWRNKRYINPPSRRSDVSSKDAFKMKARFSDDELADWEKQAIRSAIFYLDYSPFSRKVIIRLLASEFGESLSIEQAAAAVEYMEKNRLVDWQEQAVRAARGYSNIHAFVRSFSRSELLELLTSEDGEGFTVEEAEYAISQVGY